MFEDAFNRILGLHYRYADLRRFKVRGDESYSISQPIKITPSNYFRKLAGPSSVTIEGREWVISKATMSGFLIQNFGFTFPDDDSDDFEGTFKIHNGIGQTDVINSTDDASAIQTLIRALPGYDDVTVSGNLIDGLQIAFINVAAPDAFVFDNIDLTGFDEWTSVWSPDKVPWSPLLLVGDRLEDQDIGHMAITEIIELYALGGVLMGWRVRSE